MDTETFDDIFFLTLAGAIFTFLGICMKELFRSKCSDTNLCCGLIKFHRNVDIEQEIDHDHVVHGINDNISQPAISNKKIKFDRIVPV